MDSRLVRHSPTRPLVLIVDGHEEALALYAVTLYAMGFDVLAAKDGTEAVSRAREVQPDIIATELPMQADDVWDFLQRLKQDARTRDIPIVAVTGHIQQSLRERAERDEFAAVLPAPSLVDELAAGLRQVLDGKIHAPADFLSGL